MIEKTGVIGGPLNLPDKAEHKKISPGESGGGSERDNRIRGEN